MSGRPGDPPRFSYLGPAGTFTHAALRQVAGEACEVPAHDVPSALEMVRRGEARTRSKAASTRHWTA